MEEEEPLLPLADNPSRLTLEERALLPEELEEERTAELLVALLREELLLEEELRTLLPELEALELRELLLLLAEERELLELPEEELRTLLPELLEERLCCWTAEEEPLERELLLLEEERTELPEDRLLWVLWVREEPEPVDRLLEEELEDLLLCWLELLLRELLLELLRELLEERVWATMFSEASRDTARRREVTM